MVLYSYVDKWISGNLTPLVSKKPINPDKRIWTCASYPIPICRSGDKAADGILKLLISSGVTALILLHKIQRLYRPDIKKNTPPEMLAMGPLSTFLDCKSFQC